MRRRPPRSTLTDTRLPATSLVRSLLDEKLSAPLMGRLTGIRRQLSREFGFVVPPIRVRDNMSLAPHAYRVLVSGVVHGEDEVSTNDMRALDSGLVDRKRVCTGKGG